MKFITLFILFFSFISQLQAHTCYHQVASIITKLAPESDIPYRIDPEPTILPAKEALRDFYGHPVKTYKNDKLLFSFSGSYHSGWFEEVAVVNPENCWVIEFVNIYSE